MQKSFSIILFLSILAVSCKSSYIYENSDYGAGKLSSTEQVDLRDFLTKKSAVTQNDTIIINYNYNTSNCWHRLDLEDDEYILQFIEQSKEYVSKNTKDRSKMSYFQYREPGKNVNKKILWNSSIDIDQDLFLKNLLFQDQKSCGNSAIILPNGEYLMVKNDSHSTALTLSKKEIYDILLKLKNS